MAEALQRRLLPARPESRGAGDRQPLPARPAGRRSAATGTTCSTLAGGRIALAVGDVVGHGVEAAAVMGQLRTALRAYAVEGHAPAAVVDRVNGLMATLGPDAMTTLAYLVLDPAEETLELVNAGHPPPLVVAPTGAAAFLEPRAGSRSERRRRPHRADDVPVRRAGAIVVPLHGRPRGGAAGESIDAGLERLRALAEGGGRRRPAVRRHRRALVRRAPADDIAFIAARVPPLGDELVRTWPATPRASPTCATCCAAGCAAGARRDELYDITVACQEACANAIEHAYGPGVSAFVVEARLEGAPRAHDRARPTGRWRAPRGANRGRGLPLMRALMDEVDVRRSGGGTEIVMSRTLGRAS